MSDSGPNIWKWIAIVLSLALIMLCIGVGSSSATTLLIMLTKTTTDTGVVQPRPGPDGPKPVTKDGGPEVEPETDKPIDIGALHRVPLEDVPPAAFTADACDDLTEGGPVKGPSCITDVLKCDSDMIGHTVGGVDKFETKFYAEKFCWPATVDFDGGDERVYRFHMPAGEHRARITLNTPCADLSVFAVRWDGEVCPDRSSLTRQCEMSLRKGTQSEQIELVTQTQGGTDWYVVVEGRDEQEGAFSLRVDCAEGLYGAYPIDSLPK